MTDATDQSRSFEDAQTTVKLAATVVAEAIAWVDENRRRIAVEDADRTPVWAARQYLAEVEGFVRGTQLADRNTDPGYNATADVVSQGIAHALVRYNVPYDPSGSQSMSYYDNFTDDTAAAIVAHATHYAAVEDSDDPFKSDSRPSERATDLPRDCAHDKPEDASPVKSLADACPACLLGAEEVVVYGREDVAPEMARPTVHADD